MINKTTHNMGLEEEGKGIKSLFMTNSQVGWLSETKPNIFLAPQTVIVGFSCRSTQPQH